MSKRLLRAAVPAALALIGGLALAAPQQQQPPEQRERDDPPRGIPDRPAAAPVPASQEEFEALVERMTRDKERVHARYQELLNARFDLSDRPDGQATMTRGKPVQRGVRVKLAEAQTWERLAGLTPDEIRGQGLWPAGFLPLPHAHHEEGGMVFPAQHIDELREQTARDLTRFDLDFQVPEHLLAEFPPAMFLTTRSDLGDVSQGELVTSSNFNRLFNGIVTPKQLEGLRLLVTPFPQQQFNHTFDRRSREQSLGVTCFDCHANGHTNSANHLVGDIRPQEFRHTVDTPSLRGVNIQRLFGSQRALKTVEDFTEFEQLAAYFDGDFGAAITKGMNKLDRSLQVHAMSEFQEMLDFPPAPKLNVLGRLDPAHANEQELRGEALFNGKAMCSQCHPAPYYTDNSMHNLRTERFFEPQMIAGRMAAQDGPIKTFTLRGVKDSPPYLHDGRLLTLDDAVLFFDLVLGTRLTQAERDDIVAFLLCL